MSNIHNNFVVGVQCFVKLDTLKMTLSKLEECYGANKYTLILYVDSTNQILYKNKLDWIDKNKQVVQYIEKYYSDKFKHIVKYFEFQNVGPYIGCKKTVDLCFNYSDYVIFMEDDSIVSKDYLLFYENVFSQFILFDDNIFGVSANSVTNKDLTNIYGIERVHWINSTEFGITKEKWKQFGDIRAEICGDVKFGQAVKANHKYTIMPKIRRMSKIGQGHPDSFSVLQKATKESLDPNEIYLPTDSMPFDINNYLLRLF